MSEINRLFNIENYNLIQDENYYYLFRALNNGDHDDIKTGITRDGNGVLTKIRSDRARFVENPNNLEPKYTENEPISLLQVIDHIKRGHRYDTNCMSLSSNCNISIIYGNGNYNDEYAIIKVLKNKFGEDTVNASEYILSEINKTIEEALETADDDVKELIAKIDDASTREELLETIVDLYKTPQANGEEILKFTAERGTAKSKIPARGRYSNYSILTDEQNLLKNKIVAKLTMLEERKIMEPIMPHTKLDSKAIETLGMAISSSELIHYGDLNRLDENGELQMFEASKETIRMLALLQQAEQRNPNISEKIHQMENKIIQQASEGKVVEEQLLENILPIGVDAPKPTSMSIKQSYELTNGKLQYEDAQETLEKIYYISRAVVNARNYSRVINKLTEENSNNSEVIETISKYGLDIEPNLMDRKGKSIYKISEAVGISLMKHEEGLVDVIQNMSISEVEDMIESPEKIKDAINSLTNLQDESQIPIDEYYARAMFNQYNWETERIHFTQAHKESFIKKLQERPVARLYETLNNSGVSENTISTLLINLITLDREDTNQVLDEIEQGNVSNEVIQGLQSENSEYVLPLQAEQLEDYLDFYKVEGTDIKLRDYQQSAIDKVDKTFETHRFASVILPTGAGKSFVAIAELLKMQQQIEKGSDEKILYLSPSNEILDQIMKYTEKYVHGEKIDKTREQIFKEIFPNIELATYSSLLQKSDEELQEKNCRFIVLDELHRTGAEQWGEKLNTLLDTQRENTRVLGITATPQRDVDGRNMADEIALRLGYTEQEVKNRKHIAKKMDLIDAIRLGIVVNPKIVECEYNLKNDNETWESLLDTINHMDDGPEKEAYQRKYDELRNKINQAQEIPELFRDNIVKKDGRYIFYMPIGANEYEEDDEGNVIGKKTGEAKVKQAEEQLREWLKYVDGEPEFYSMLGEYGDKKNAQQLEQFEKSTSEHTKIMIVMNKLNEGVHVEGINGIIWHRSLDENSRILLLQQLGRAIYSPKEGEKINEEDRPVVIDLPNNLSKVDLEKVINNYDEIDDIELLQNVMDWIDEHDGILPDINAGFREESRLASTLKRIQKKYIKYNNDEEFEKLSEERADKVDAILELGSEIDLWNLELQDKDVVGKDGKVNKDNLYDFALKGVVKEFADFVEQVNYKGNTVERFISTLSKLKRHGIDVSKLGSKDTIMTLAKKSRFTDMEALKKEELNLDDNIGNTKSTIAQAYRGNGKSIPPTEKQVKTLLEEYGISLEKQNAIQEFIDKLEILKKHGIDVSKLGQSDTIMSLAKKSEFTDMEALKKEGLNLDDNIGVTKKGIALAYRGKGKYTPPTEKQVKTLLEEYGISLEKQDRNATQELIDKLEILKRHGIDVSKLGSKDTIMSLAKNSGFTDMEALKKEGLKLDDNIGRTKNGIVQAYRGKGTCTPPTEKQVKTLLEEYEISLEKQDKNATQEFIDKLEILKKHGIDVSKLGRSDTIMSLAKNSGFTDMETLEKEGLKLDDKIGRTKNNITQAYRGNNEGKPPTEKQVKILLEEYGILLEKQDRNATQEFIDKLEILKKHGIDVSKLGRSDTIMSLARNLGFTDMETLEKEGLKLDDKIGRTKNNITQAYRGKGTYTPPTEKQVKTLLEEYGISLEKQYSSDRNVTQEFIDKLEILKRHEIDISKLVQRDTIMSLAKKSGFTDMEALKKEGLNLDDNIGTTKNTIAQAYRGNGNSIPPTEKQVKTLLEEYGISLEKQDVTQEFIDKLEILKRHEINISKLVRIDTIMSLAKKSGFTDMEALEKEGLKLDDKIGNTKSTITQAYRGKGKSTPPTEEQVKTLLEEYGISLELKQTKSQDIGKATFDANTQTCIETATLIDELVEEKQHKSLDTTHSK